MTTSFVSLAPLHAPSGRHPHRPPARNAIQSVARAPRSNASRAQRSKLPEHPNYSVNRDRVVLFDGACVLCNTGVDILLRLDPNARFKLAALQSTPGRALTHAFGCPDDLSTVVFVDGDVAYVRSDAVLRLAAQLDVPALAVPAKVALAAVPRPVRDFVYTEIVARNRYWVFGKSDSCRMMEPGEEHRFIM